MLLRQVTTFLAASAPPRHASVVRRAAVSTVRGISISDTFDSGRIAVAGGDESSAVQLKLKHDPYTDLEKKAHMQWFAFRATSEINATVKYQIVNAGDASYPGGWTGYGDGGGYEVVASHDRQTWHRVASTSYDSDAGVLSWEWTHSSERSSVYFAYFDMYSYDRHLELVARCAAATDAPGLRVRSLGQTLEGREIDCVSVGTGPLQAWVIHRQHPGESMAEFYAEGLLDRLLGLSSDGNPDALTRRLMQQFTFHVVPSMNPDGAARGHLRVNAGGANLNREWADTGDYAAPTLERSPEVFHVLKAMDATGVDFFVDVHGDEALPFTFCAGGQGLGVWGPRHEALHGAFVASYARANPDMQKQFGYAPDPPNEGNLAICSNQVAQRFDCLGVTLEMPFKDSAAVPRDKARGETRGFDGSRARSLGASLLDALAHVGPQLRGFDRPHFDMADDAYVDPTEDAEAIAAWLAQRCQ